MTLRRSLSVDAADVSRQRLDFCLDGHRRGRNARLSAQSRSARGFRIDGKRADHHALRGADGLDLVWPMRRTNLRRLAPKGVRVLTAGAPPAASTIQRLEEELGWTITQAYGLTETAPFITICEPRPEHASLSPSERAAIKARQGVELITSGELRVVDEEGNEVPHDGMTQGEIVARGNVVMAGYYNDPEATEEAMRGGWFHTGDAAVVHPDGYVEIRDRLKDVIISGGENISSVEVEGVLVATSGGAGGRDRRACRMNAGARRRTLLLCSSKARCRQSANCASLRAPTSRISKRRTP